MAQFSQLMITNKGQALIAKVLEGASGVSFTKVCTSSATYDFNELKDLTSLSEIEQTTSISKISRTNDVTVTIEAAFANTELTTGYFVRAVGLYATDPDDGEILYAVSIEESGSCWMPPFNGITVSDIYLKLVTAVGNADNILIEVSSAATATVWDIADLWAYLAQKGGIRAVGELKYFAGTTVPEHCLACDGSAISRTAYPELFAAIGTTYGSGDGSTTFNLPNASGVIYGQVGRTVGASVSAGLPNIEGNVWFRKSSAMSFDGVYSCPLFRTAGWGNWGVSGAFTADDPSSGRSYYSYVDIAWGSPDEYYIASQLAIDASASNSIYGNSTTVQSEGLVANVCIVYE